MICDLGHKVEGRTRKEKWYTWDEDFAIIVVYGVRCRVLRVKMEEWREMMGEQRKELEGNISCFLECPWSTTSSLPDLFPQSLPEQVEQQPAHESPSSAVATYN